MSCWLWSRGLYSFTGKPGRYLSCCIPLDLLHRLLLNSVLMTGSTCCLSQICLSLLSYFEYCSGLATHSWKWFAVSTDERHKGHRVDDEVVALWPFRGGALVVIFHKPSLDSLWFGYYASIESEPVYIITCCRGPLVFWPQIISERNRCPGFIYFKYYIFSDLTLLNKQVY